MLQNSEVEIKIKNRARELLKDIDVLIGYTHGNVPARVKPLFIAGATGRDGTSHETAFAEQETAKTAEVSAADRLVFNKLCINNLSSYAYTQSSLTDGKTGIILKPCDVRSIVQLISEELIPENKIYAIVAGCSGVFDYRKISKLAGSARIVSLKEQENDLIIDTVNKSVTAKKTVLYAEKCHGCTIYDNPPYSSEFIENPLKPEILNPDLLPSDAAGSNKEEDVSLLEKLENSSLAEVASFWDTEFERCMRCYACRNICPLEVCRDRCITHIDSPKWQTQRINSKEGKFFQLIRVMHLAGRCTECGECERACPQNIPVLTLMKKMNRVVSKLFNYTAGMDIEQKPPLLTYKNVEKNITEEELV